MCCRCKPKAVNAEMNESWERSKTAQRATGSAAYNLLNVNVLASLFDAYDV